MSLTVTHSFVSGVADGANAMVMRPSDWGSVAGGAKATHVISGGVPADVGLGNVENTALSTWGGSANLTTTGPLALVVGGTLPASTLTFRATSGVGVGAEAIIFQVGNNGATEVMRLTPVLTSTPNNLLITGPGGWSGLSLSPSAPLIVQSLAAGIELVQTGFGSTDVHYRWQIHNSVSSGLFEFNYFTGNGVSVQTGWTMNPTNAAFISNGSISSPSISASTFLVVPSGGSLNVGTGTWVASTNALTVPGVSTLTGAVNCGSTLTASGNLGLGGALITPGLLKGGWDLRSNGALVHSWGVGRAYLLMTAVTDLANLIMEVTTSGTAGGRAFQQSFGFDVYSMAFVSEASGAVISTPLTLGLSGGSVKVGGKFGCNGKAVQSAFASGGVLAAYASGTAGFDTGAHASALYAQVVAIQAALVADGIMS